MDAGSHADYSNDRGFTGAHDRSEWNSYGSRDDQPSYGSDQSMYGQGRNQGSSGQGRAVHGLGQQPGQDRGMRGMHRGKGPKGYQRSDERIRESVSEALEHDEHIDATHIEVVVKNGEVTLTGTVDDRQTKRAAEDCIAHLPGVKDVQNSLRVQGERTQNQNGSHANGNGKSEAMGRNETETSGTSSTQPKARA
jgi:osmotically-inducible protein OsmY